MHNPLPPAVAHDVPDWLWDRLGDAYGEGRYDEASAIFAKLVDDDTFVEFLTLPAYERID